MVQESKIEEESDDWDNMNTNSKGAQMVDPNPAQSVDNRGPIAVPGKHFSRLFGDDHFSQVTRNYRDSKKID